MDSYVPFLERRWMVLWTTFCMPSPLLSTDEAIPGVHCAFSGLLVQERDAATGGGPVKGHRDREWIGRSTTHMKKCWQSWDSSVWKSLKGISSVFVSNWKEGGKRTDSGSCQCCRERGQQEWALTRTQQIPSEHQETLLPFVGDHALAQIAQRLWRLSFQRSPKTVWIWLWATCSACLCLSRVWTKWTKRSLTTSAVLWFFYICTLQIPRLLFLVPLEKLVKLPPDLITRYSCCILYRFISS